MPEIQKIRLAIVSRMTDPDGKKQEIRSMYKGTLEQISDGIRLRYTDTQNDERADVTLDVAPERAQMLRRGMTSARLPFLSGQRTNGRYTTLYGEIPVSVLTHALQADWSSREHGSLTVRYALFVSGDKTADTELTIRWKAEA